MLPVLDKMRHECNRSMYGERCGFPRLYVSKAINFLPDTVVRVHEFCLEMMIQERCQDTNNLLNSICMCLKLGGLMMHGSYK